MRAVVRYTIIILLALGAWIGYRLLFSRNDFELLIQKREEIRRLQEQNEELKRHIARLQERAPINRKEPLLCAGTFSRGCGNGPAPPLPPWAEVE